MPVKTTTEKLPPPITFDPNHPSTIPKLDTQLQPDGGIQVRFLIEPADARRLMLKAGGMPLDRFLWENLIKPSVSGFLY